MRLKNSFNWKRLGEVCEKPEYGYTTSADFNGKGPRFLRTTDISGGKVNWESVPFCAVLPEHEARYNLRDGDLLISRAGSVGVSVTIKNPPRAIFASYLIRFRPKKDLDSSYAGFFLKSNFFFSQLGGKTSGTTLPGVNATNLANVQIPIPSLPTQRKIASILDKCASARAKRKEASRLTDEFLKSVFLEMFGDPARNPKGWSTGILKNLIKIDRSNILPEEIKGDTKYIGLEHIESETGKILSYEAVDAGQIKSTKFVFSKEHVLLGKLRSYLNKVTMPDFNGVCSTDILPLFPKEKKANRCFIAYLLRHKSFVNYATNRSTGANLPRINPRTVEEFRCYAPSFTTQQKFADIVQKVDKLKEKQRESEKELDNLFNSLMQRAFRKQGQKKTLIN